MTMMIIIIKKYNQLVATQYSSTALTSSAGASSMSTSLDSPSVAMLVSVALVSSMVTGVRVLLV